jgi:putative ABC transport system substrate-binding protein
LPAVAKKHRSLQHDHDVHTPARQYLQCVIVAAGLDAVVAARNVTQTIPIVSATLADAIHLCLIANEARPTGNVTGLEPYVAGLPAKQMEFAREIMPGASKIGLLTNLSDPKAPPQVQELLAAGRSLEIEVTSSDANRPEEIESVRFMGFPL